ncbi:MAG: TIM barrel protein [Phycisphaerae bacterium]|nr:TIM barrel protein [Phycisphaerae bacterium]
MRRMTNASRRSVLASGVLGGVGLATGSLSVAATSAPAPFRMRYGPHPGMFREHAGDSVVDQIAFFADQGFTGFEDNGMKGRSVEEQTAIAKELERRGVMMGIFVGADIDWSEPTLTTGDAGARDRFVSNIRDSVEVAKRMNTKTTTIVPGVEARNLPQGIQTANVVETLKRACDVCAPSGLVMVLEPLNWRDHPGLFVRYSDHAYEIMKAVNHPSCKILFDIYHQQASEGNLIDNIGRCWDEIGYLQIGDNPGRCEPGTGEINYRNVFKFINERGYKGVLGMEHGKKHGGKDGELKLIEAYRAADQW